MVKNWSFCRIDLSAGNFFEDFTGPEIYQISKKGEVFFLPVTPLLFGNRSPPGRAVSLLLRGVLYSPGRATPEGRDLSTQKIHIKKEGTNLKPLQFLVDFGEEVSPCIDEEGGLFRHLYRQDVPIVEFRDI